MNEGLFLDCTAPKNHIITIITSFTQFWQNKDYCQENNTRFYIIPILYVWQIRKKNKTGKIKYKEQIFLKVTHNGIQTQQ